MYVCNVIMYLYVYMYVCGAYMLSLAVRISLMVDKVTCADVY